MNIIKDRTGEKREMNCGMFATIFHYNKENNIDIIFDDGETVSNKTYGCFKRGSIKHPIIGSLKHKSLINKKIDLLYVEEFLYKEKMKRNDNSNSHIYYYKCKCDCGNECIKSSIELNIKSKTGSLKSCGCKEYYNKFSKNKKEIELSDFMDNNQNALTKKSNKVVEIVCSVCNKKEFKKVFEINEIDKYICKTCRGGGSYPERIFSIILNQLDVKYKKEVVFSWAKNKRYDFYLEDFNCIVELNGIQHYKENNLTKRSLLEEKENDLFKENLAKENNISKYIIIDCRFSKIDYIKNSILNSDLKNIFNINNIDWMNCEKMANYSILNIICEIWKNLFSTTKISKELNLDKCTIIKYLKIGNNIGLCEYPSEIANKIAKETLKNKISKKIICNELNMEFDSMVDCKNYITNIVGIKVDDNLISKVCRGKIKTHKGFTFSYK